MNSYWLSRTGDGAADGLFTLPQIEAMNLRGEIGPEAQMCLRDGRTWQNVWQTLNALRQPVEPQVNYTRKITNRRSGCGPGLLMMLALGCFGLALLSLFGNFLGVLLFGAAGVFLFAVALYMDSDAVSYACGHCGNAVPVSSRMCPVCRSVFGEPPRTGQTNQPPRKKLWDIGGPWKGIVWGSAAALFIAFWFCIWLMWVGSNSAHVTSVKSGPTPEQIEARRKSDQEMLGLKAKRWERLAEVYESAGLRVNRNGDYDNITVIMPARKAAGMSEYQLKTLAQQARGVLGDNSIVIFQDEYGNRLSKSWMWGSSAGQ